jgi:hypothetical protein
MEVTAEKFATPCSHMTSNQNSDQSSKSKFELFSEGCQLFPTGCSILGGELMIIEKSRKTSIDSLLGKNSLLEVLIISIVP